MVPGPLTPTGYGLVISLLLALGLLVAGSTAYAAAAGFFAVLFLVRAGRRDERRDPDEGQADGEDADERRDRQKKELKAAASGRKS